MRHTSFDPASIAATLATGAAAIRSRRLSSLDARRACNERAARRLVGPHDADGLTRRLSCFPSFAALVEAKGGYRPTIRPDLGADFAVLADLYDAAQLARGDERRAYRG